MTDYFDSFDSPHTRMPAFASGSAEQAFGDALVQALRKPDAALAGAIGQFAATAFPQDGARMALVLYAPGHARILVSRAGSPHAGLSQTIQRLAQHPRCAEMLEADGLRIQMDCIGTPPAPMDLRKVGMSLRGERHFEVGVEGIELMTAAGRRHLFLPGDAYVYSIMSMQQLRQHLKARYGDDTVDSASCGRFRSDSYLWDGHRWQRLYRGIPLVGPLKRHKLDAALELAVDHIQREQKPNGRYLYYYDAASDSERDHEHPTRDPDVNPYYNILRHCGGALTCLYRDQLQGGNATLGGVRQAIDYLLEQARTYATEGGEAAYIYSERKAKLGGSGLALYLLAEYELASGDDRYRPWAERIARHLLGQITASGEFIYYSIYLDEPIDEAKNSNYFSFYYPGEAICGLARYLHLVGPDVQAPFFEALHRALHYLIHVRPSARASEYTAVPSDAWLMMGIKELWDFEPMQRIEYLEFVLQDARQMIAQMYRVDSAPYPDYAGGFFYEFGDYPYSDGARMEGLMGAYQLALKAGEHTAATNLWPALCLGAWATLHLVNTPDATYAAPNRLRSLGGIRFKYTRQWFRIDTIQHVASFYARLLRHWPSDQDDPLPCSSR